MLGRISFLLDFEIPLEPDKFKFASLSGESVRTFAHLIKLAKRRMPLRNPFLRFCWYHRKTLQRHPKLRYFDPFYMLPMALDHRLRKLRKVLATRNGARYMLSQILAPGNYMRLWTDLVKGGR